jgi:hypothetical protein
MKTMNFSEALRHHEDEAKALGTGLHDLSALVPYALPTNRLHFGEALGTPVWREPD